MIFLALTHEPHLPTVSLADQEVLVEVGEVEFHDEVVVADELLDGVQPLHLKVLVLDVPVRLAKIDTSTQFVGTFL